jgi:hypothetical protein
VRANGTIERRGITGRSFLRTDLRSVVVIAVRLVGLVMLLWGSGGVLAFVLMLALLATAGSVMSGNLVYSGGAAVIVALATHAPSVAWFTLGFYLFAKGRWVFSRLFRGLGTNCFRCGYDLAGIPGGKCPECGARFVARDDLAA